MLYLIGSAHSNIRQSNKNLIRIYSQIKPEIVMSETSPEEALVFESRVPELVSALRRIYPENQAKQAVELLRESYFGFEYCFNRNYHQNNPIEHICIDQVDKIHALKIRANIDELIEMLKKGQANLVRESLKYKKRPEESILEIRKKWKFYEKIEATPELDDILKDDEEFKRDIEMEKNIRKLFREDKTLVALIGAIHTLETLSGVTLYSRLRDLNPKRIYLFKPIES